MAEDLVEKVINFFSGDGTENLSDKEVVLRQRLKELNENKYAKFFRHKTDEADPSLGQFFYSLYKMILPSRIFMKDVAKTTRLRQVVLEAFMDADITETVKRLSPAVIEERMKTTPPEELTDQISQDIEKINSRFDTNRKHGINRCYNLVMVFFQLVNFDYPALIKKFDPNFTEGPFASDPKFSAVKVTQLTKELAEFLAVSQELNPDNDWKTLLKLLKICAGEDLISENQFAQLLIGLRDIINSKILELIVQYSSKNPVWLCKPRIPDEHVAEAWLEVRTLKAQECVDRINENEKNKQIDALVKKIFDTTEDLVRLDNYTSVKGEMYRKRDLSYYVYADGLNYLSAFLEGFMEKNLHELCDILLIRGQWTNNAFSKEMSEALHQLLGLPMSISKLDLVLAEEGGDGSRLKAAMIRIDRDKTQARYVNAIIDNINDTAQELLSSAAENFFIVGKHLKNLADDIQKKHPELIINWRELNLVAKNPIAPQMAADHEKIADFVKLMQLYVE
ncbi:MAG: DUF5312 family protein [Treponema sp.]|nr:DUF5312 family protein [Treponema sp.]